MKFVRFQVAMPSYPKSNEEIADEIKDAVDLHTAMDVVGDVVVEDVPCGHSAASRSDVDGVCWECATGGRG